MKQFLVYQITKAIYSKDIEYCRKVLDYGLSIRTDEDINHLVEAVDSGCIEIVTLFLKNYKEKIDSYKIGELEKNQVTPLILSIRKEDYEMCELLLSFGADINRKNTDRFSSTPLSVAVYERIEGMVHFLISKGANPNVFYCMRSLISWSCYKLEFGIFKTLLEAGADVNLRISDNENTPLISLLSKDIVWTKEIFEIFDLLLESGANPDVGRNSFGRTPLSCIIEHHPYKFTSRKLWKDLIERGASINITDPNDRCPLSQTIFVPKPEIAKYLLDHGANTKTNSVFEKMKLIEGEIPSRHKSVYNLIKEESDKRDRKILMEILLWRKFCPESPFHEDNLPLDLLKLILNESLIKFLLPQRKYPFLNMMKTSMKNIRNGINEVVLKFI